MRANPSHQDCFQKIGDPLQLLSKFREVKVDTLTFTAIKLRKKDRFYGIMMYTNKFKGSMSKKGSNKIYSK